MKSNIILVQTPFMCRHKDILCFKEQGTDNYIAVEHYAINTHKFRMTNYGTRLEAMPGYIFELQEDSDFYKITEHVRREEKQAIAEVLPESV
jgi:hypothetical protein